MKYLAPIHNNQVQYVPVVVKNKDFLLGYCYGVGNLIYVIPELKKTRIPAFIDSCRFNDYIKDGVKLSLLSEQDKINIIQEYKERKYSNDTHVENNITPEQCLLHIDCVCGMNYTYKTEQEIPENNLICDCCQRVLIDYTYIDDHEFEYDN